MSEATSEAEAIASRITDLSPEKRKRLERWLEEESPQGPSWFVRNPKKTLFGGAGVILLLLFGLAEYILEKVTPPPPPRRSIRLKEHPPFLDQVIMANRQRLENQYGLIVDSLEEKAYVFRTDEHGFVMPSKVYDHPDLSLVFLGGSTTECTLVDEDSRFPYRAGVLLSQRVNKKVNAYNGGVRGNNSVHSLNILLNKVAPLHPDIVVLMHNINDVNMLLFAKTYWNNNPTRSALVVTDPRKDRLKRFFTTTGETLVPGLYYGLELDRLFRGRSKDEFEEERRTRDIDPSTVDKKAFEANLITFVNICRARQMMPVLMTEFSRMSESPDEVTKKNIDKFEADWGVDYAGYKGLFDQFNDIIRQVARDTGVLLIDLDAQVPKEKTYMFDIVHLNTEGSKLVSTIVAAGLADSVEAQRLLLRQNDFMAK